MSIKNKIKKWLDLSANDIKIKEDKNKNSDDNSERIELLNWSSMFRLNRVETIKDNIDWFESKIKYLDEKISELQKRETYMEKYLNISFSEDKTVGYKKVKKEKKKKVTRCCCDSSCDYED